MILKARNEPLELFQLESLLKRLPDTHIQLPHWTEKLRRISAGYNGELRVDSLWHEIDIPIPHYFLHDLFIQKEQSSHQMDSILVTNRFVLILEIKSISGLLNFDSTTRQFSRTNKDGSIDGMRNPDDQVRRHEKWVAHFLAAQKVKLPVIGAIVFTYPSSIIQSRSGKRLMIQSSGLPYLMDQLLATHSQEILTKKKTESIARQLLSLHSEKPVVLPTLPASFLKGVLCPECPSCKLVYRHKKWSCPNCVYVNFTAHLDALRQYRVLIAPEISSREFRDFTGIESVSITSKLLKESGMAYRGSFKDRVYLIPESFIVADSK